LPVRCGNCPFIDETVHPSAEDVKRYLYGIMIFVVLYIQLLAGFVPPHAI